LVSIGKKFTKSNNSNTWNQLNFLNLSNTNNSSIRSRRNAKRIHCDSLYWWRGIFPKEQILWKFTTKENKYSEHKFTIHTNVGKCWCWDIGRFEY
jgi:hypothetical protein